MAKQPLLGRQATCVAGQAAVAADHAMTRHDDRDRVASVGHADGPDRAWVADALGNLAVRRGFAERDASQFCPYPLLKVRSARSQCQVELLPDAGEVFSQLRPRFG